MLYAVLALAALSTILGGLLIRYIGKAAAAQTAYDVAITNHKAAMAGADARIEQLKKDIEATHAIQSTPFATDLADALDGLPTRD